MSIIWTNWRVALWRGRYTGPLSFICCFALMQLTLGRPSPVDPEVGLTILHRSALFNALYIFFLSSGLLHAVLIHERDVTAKPLAFCLPGYRQSLRGLNFTAALPWGVLVALMEAPRLWIQWHSPRVENPGLFDVFLCLGCAFLVGVAISLAVHASRLILSKLQWSILALTSFPLCILGVALWLNLDMHTPLFWGVAAFVSALVVVLFWVRLGNMRYVTRGHRAIIDGAMDKRAQAGVKRTTPPWAGEFFLLRMELCSHLGAWRYLWGGLYQAFGRVLSYWKWMLVGGFLVSLVLGFAPGSFAQLVFTFLGIGVSLMELPATSSMLLPGGRRERHYATVIAAVVASLLLLAVASVIAGLSEIMAVVLGSDVGSFGVRLGSVWLACVFVPWICAARFPGYGLAGIRVVSMVVVAGVFGSMAFSVSSGTSRWPAQMRLLLLASVCLCGWAVFLLTSRHVCLRGSLVEQDARAGG
jgi:hypothetical protein